MEPRIFKVSFEQCPDGWLASIYAVPGCHAEGTTKAEARAGVVAALALFFKDVSDDRIVDDA